MDLYLSLFFCKNSSLGNSPVAVTFLTVKDALTMGTGHLPRRFLHLNKKTLP